MKRILIIDDEESALDLLRRILEQEGYEVAAARNGQEGVEIFRRQQFDLVVTDMVIPLIAISGGGAIAKERYLNVAGYIEGVCTLPKPFSRVELLSAIDKLLNPPAVDSQA
jgi:CheY-like chemotaxis protein